MTNEEKQDLFKSLIYDLGEADFNAINHEFWEKYINKNEPFNEKQMTYFDELIRHFTPEMLIAEEVVKLKTL